VAYDGTIFISDSGNHRVLKLSNDRLTITVFAGVTGRWGSNLTSVNPLKATLRSPSLIWVTFDDEILITMENGYRVIVPMDGKTIAYFNPNEDRKSYYNSDNSSGEGENEGECFFNWQGSWSEDVVVYKTFPTRRNKS
jgi:hypothetical protein